MIQSPMRVFFIFLVLISPAVANDKLTAVFEAELKKSLYEGVSVGISINKLTGPSRGEAVYTRNTDRAYTPASAFKLASSAFALKTLGAGHYIKTPVFLADGSLFIAGRGDPSLTTADLSKAAQEIYARGIAAVNDVCYDNTYFTEERSLYAPNARHLYTPPSALTVNYGWINVNLVNNGKPILTMEPETAYARLNYDIKLSDSTKAGLASMTYKEQEWETITP